MPMVTFMHKGQFQPTYKFFKTVLDIKYEAILHKYGQRGVDALAAATPKKTGLTAASWSYEVSSSSGGLEIVWSNPNENKGFHIAIGLQFGHGTGWGGYVTGIDYINPAIEPLFKAMADELWNEVTSA